MARTMFLEDLCDIDVQECDVIVHNQEAKKGM